MRMKTIHCTYPWLLVVGGHKQRSRLCIQDEGNCSTGSVIWCVCGVNDQFEKRVWVAWALFWNEFPFLVKSLDVELLIRLFVVP